MTDEAQTIIGAGLETTAWALSHATYYIIANPSIHSKLCSELENAIPDTRATLDWLQVEKLPYLTACIREAIRMSYGVSARNPRLLEKQTMYKSWKIPAKTPISMTIIDVHTDPEIYPEPFAYTPERWLNNPKAPNGSPLDRYFVAFGKGTRSCLGINLAYCELYLTLASLFQRFKFELYETDATDLLLAHDYFLPNPKLDSKGVRVKIIEDALKA
jgi:cytochrome P450